MSNESKKTLVSIVEEMRKEGEITSMRMFTIQNLVRKSLGLSPKKMCSANRQRLVNLVRKVLGEDNLNEKIEYSASYGEGRKPTKFSITDSEKALSDIEKYFSKVDKVKRASNSHKKEAVSKLLSILAKVSESSSDCTISRDLLSQLIDAKTPVCGTLKNWSIMLEKEGIKLSITSSGRGGLFKVENLQETKKKLEDLYGKLTAESDDSKIRRPTKPIVTEEYKDLEEHEEAIVFCIAQLCDHKEVLYSRIWSELKRRGFTAGFNISNLIKRAGLKKWFVQTKKVMMGGSENQLEFVGNLEAVASLMGQEIEKTILVRSSLEPEEIKSMMSNSKIVLKSSMPNANIYSVRYSKESMLSKLDLFKLKMSFREYDSFIEEADEDFVEGVIDEISELITK